MDSILEDMYLLLIFLGVTPMTICDVFRSILSCCLQLTERFSNRKRQKVSQTHTAEAKMSKC